MATTGDLVDQFGVTKQTIRSWTAEFAEHLSPLANPPKGGKRIYEDDDVRVMAAVAQLRQAGRSFADIHGELSEGKRVDPEEVPSKEIAERPEFAPVSVLEEFAKRIATQYEGQIAQLENERDHLRGQVTDGDQEIGDERKARRIAEVDAAQLRGRLEELEKPPAWQFWRRG